MPTLILVFLMGVFAAVWGFTACFLPKTWNRFTEKISFADRWSDASPKLQHPLVRLVIRVGQCVGGLSVCAVGCWFAYLAISGIYRQLTGQAGGVYRLQSLAHFPTLRRQR